MKETSEACWEKKAAQLCHLGLNNFHIPYWKCASVKQRGLILENLAYWADIVALQQNHLGNSVIRLVGISCFYNRRHLGLDILVQEDIMVSEADVS